MRRRTFDLVLPVQVLDFTTVLGPGPLGQGPLKVHGPRRACHLRPTGSRSACGTRIRAHRRTRLCRRPTARAPRLPAKWPPRGMGVQRWSAYTGILIARCSTHTKTAITPLMADAVRRALLIGESTDPEVLDAPGMIVLGPGWRPESISPGLEEWLRDLPDGNWAASRLPTAVLAVAGRAARSATSTGDPAEVAVGSGIDPFGPLGGSARCTARCGRQ